MSEPFVNYSVKEVLTRIELKLDANTEAIRKLQLADAASAAASRARAAIWAAIFSAVTAGAALLVALH